jgi:hypothetical protein
MRAACINKFDFGITVDLDHRLTIHRSLGSQNESISGELFAALPTMIIIVYGSILTPFPKNWAAIVG